MQQLTILIRLEQRELDQLRVQMGRLERQRDSLIAQIEYLSEQLLREVELAAQLPDLRGFFGDFSGAIKHKQQQLAASVVKTEQQIQNLMVKIQDRFSALKKYEIAYERYLEEQRALLAMQEQKMLDEVGIRNYQYQETSS